MRLNLLYVVCKSSLRILFELTANLYLSIDYLGIGSTLLNENLNGSTYMQQTDDLCIKAMS